jgi:hypothetical protein
MLSILAIPWGYPPLPRSVIGHDASGTPARASRDGVQNGPPRPILAWWGGTKRSAQTHLRDTRLSGEEQKMQSLGRAARVILITDDLYRCVKVLDGVQATATSS